MIEASHHSSLGSFLYEALVTFKRETAFIETRRERVVGRWSYAEALAASGAVAARLVAEGIGPGARVAILATNQPAWLLGAIACFWVGAQLVPLDARASREQQQALLDDATPDLLIADDVLWRGLARPPQRSWRIDAPEYIDEHERWTVPKLHETDWPPRAPVEREAIAVRLYTSGTGGRPRACLLSHANYLAQWEALAARFPLAPGHRWLSILPTNHAIDFMCGFIGPLGCGATIVHPRALRPASIAWALKHCQITHMAAVPMLLEALARRVQAQLEALPAWQRTALEGLAEANLGLTRKRPRPQLSRRLLAPIAAAFGGRLELIFCGGAYVRPDLAEFFYRLGIPVVIGYGLSEACTVVTLADLAPFRADGVGRPLASIELRIHAPDGQGIGEVEIRGPTVMRGYAEPEDNDAAFTPDGWLRTGDRGRLDGSGHLQLRGRSKNMIVTSGGKNIDPEQVERELGELPCEGLVVYAASYLWPERGIGADAEQLVAVARHPQSELFGSRLRTANRGLPSMRRVAGWITWDQEFPRTSSLKIKRCELAASVRAAHLPMELLG